MSAGGERVRVRVAGVAVDGSGQHVILLKPLADEEDDGLILPIWIGEQEATSILVAIQGARAPRPLAHDLMRDMLESLDASIDAVEIVRIEDGTFFAEVVLSAPSGVRRLDARPSDAVALASRTDASIWVASAVLEEAGIPDTVTGDDDEDEGAPQEAPAAAAAPAASVSGPDAEARVDEFKRFLDDVDPDDFRDD